MRCHRINTRLLGRQITLLRPLRAPSLRPGKELPCPHSSTPRNTAKSAVKIQADINRVVTRLRALRTQQADIHFTTQPARTLKLRALQEKLDRLYEEKRAGGALGPSQLRPLRRNF